MIPKLHWWISSSLLCLRFNVIGALWRLWHGTLRGHAVLELGLEWGPQTSWLQPFLSDHTHTDRACEDPERWLLSGLPCSGGARSPSATWNISDTHTVLAMLSSSSLSAWRMQVETEGADARGEKTHWWMPSFRTPSYLPSLLHDSLQLVPLLVLQVFLNIQIELINIYHIYSERPSFLVDTDLLTNKNQNIGFFKLFCWQIWKC